MFPIENLCDEVDPRLNKLAAGKAFLYLYRRFGFPNSGSDRHKSVCEYMIECSAPGTFVILTVRSTLCKITWSARRKQFNQYYDDERTTRRRKKKTKWMEQCHESTKEVLRDLLRPVFVRDVPIWIFGAEDEGGISLESAEPAKTAGYGLSSDLFEDIGAFYDLIDHVRGLGYGSFAKGAKLVVNNSNL